jgi:hypothetical protein
MRLLAVQLLHWNEGGNLARNTLIIIDALEPKKGKRIHVLLNQSGYTDTVVWGMAGQELYHYCQSVGGKGDYRRSHGNFKRPVKSCKYTAQEYVKQPALNQSVKTLMANGK